MRWRIIPQLQNKIGPVVLLAAAAICAPASGSPREDELKRLVRQTADRVMA